MTQPPPTVTFRIAAAQMSVVLIRLSTFLLRAHYAFLYTFHSAEHAELDIFDQHHACAPQGLLASVRHPAGTHERLLIRCILQVVDAGAAAPAPPVSPTPEALAADLMSLLHDLVQTSLSTLGVVGTASETHGEDDDERQQNNNEVRDHLHTLAHPLHDVGIIRIDASVHTRQTKCHAKELHGHQEQHQKHRR
jgi:hypothetical protein